MSGALFRPGTPGAFVAKVKYELRMSAGNGVAILIDTLDNPETAIARCEAEADKTGVSHYVRRVETITIYRAARAASDQRAFAESVGALLGERLST